MSPREELHARGFDFFMFHLLCAAKQFEAKITAQGFECHLVTETYGPHRQTVYYLGHKQVGKPTRRERLAHLTR
jgi:hypothetical protein